MKKSKVLVFAVALFALLFGAKAVSANSLTLNVDNVYTSSTSITGDATKGVSVIVRDANKNVLAQSAADSVNGKFQVNLSSRLKANQKVYVYARQNGNSYFYRVITVKPVNSKVNVANTAATAPKKNSTKSGSKTAAATKGLTINTPTGTWKSGNNSGYTVVTKFSQATGLNQALYYNGKFVKKLINYAKYDVDANGSFWKITYTQRGQKKSQAMYLRFTSNNTFWIVNSANKATKVKFGNAPVHYYKFALQK